MLFRLSSDKLDDQNQNQRSLPKSGINSTESPIFTLDNVAITLCDYFPSELSDENSFLSFSCNFDDLTMCKMKNRGLFVYTIIQAIHHQVVLSIGLNNYFLF